VIKPKIAIRLLFAFIAVFFLIRIDIIAQSIDKDRLFPLIEKEIHRMMTEAKVPSATVALVYKDKIIWIGAFGYTNLWAKVKASPDSVYLIGSTFKTMSMYALFQQMEKGLFKLDDPVNDYLKDLRIRGDDPSNPVTFRSLLTHTSGLPGDFGPHPVWGNTVPPSLKDYLRKSLRLKNPPMTKLVYSNLAYTLIAYLVENFSGTPFKKYIKRHIWEPVEMYDTEFTPSPDMEERLAIPYIYDKKTETYKPTTQLKANVWPAGIVYGTIENQAKWLITNLNGGEFKKHRLISEETFYQTMARQYDKFTGPISNGWLNKATGFGLTWWISRYKGDILFAHSGSVPGYTAFLNGNLDKKTGIAILTNGNKVHSHLFKLATKALDLMEAHKKNY